MGHENRSSLGTSCAAICWLMAIFLGVLVLAVLMTWAAWSWILALLVAAIAAFGAAWLLTVYFCDGRAARVALDRGTLSGALDTGLEEAAAAEAKTAVVVKEAEANMAAASKVATEAKTADAAKAAAEDAKTADAKAAASARVEGDYDGDGVVEGTNEGVKPATLDGARGGKADDLKMIKGIGPKMETMCNTLGFYHFDQIAGWSADEVAWVNANLKGFKGRVTRDKWVAQAKLLATGGETEFSKRVEDGGVY